MAISSVDQKLPVIPEAAPLANLASSAQPSPRSTRSTRSTSDSLPRAPQPISPNSRLLQPTLSWQAKAGWMPDAPAAPNTSTTDDRTHSDTFQHLQPVTAEASHSIRIQAAASSSMSSGPPSASWQPQAEPQQKSDAVSGQQAHPCITMWHYHVQCTSVKVGVVCA